MIYKTKKDQLLKQIIQTLDSKFPNLSQHLTHAELATPKTIKRYIRTKSGTPYGFAQDKEGMGYRLGWKSKSVKNLYFASVFCFPGGGFTGAILGGYRTANLILNPYSFFKRLTLCVAFGVSVSLLIQFTLKALF